MRDAEAVTFAGADLDRATHLRADPSGLAALWARGDARCLAVWRNRPLLDTAQSTRLAWLPTDSAALADGGEPPLFLGLSAGAPRFARAIPDWQAPAASDAPPPFVDTSRQAHPKLPETLAFGDLRASMGELPAADAGNAAMARGLLAWHETHGFCARCGQPSRIDQGGWRRICPACNAQHFPRTDPVVIMLVIHGSSVLLGRSPHWPEGMYSLLAGFMEPGESIEAAVRREVFEEAGIRIGAVEYLASQPWPFPSSLMIGCRGTALSAEIACDPAELEDARWLSREDTLAALHGRIPGIRPARRGSIARFLIERWLADRLR
jgi:NAD+ diphosphatase